MSPLTAEAINQIRRSAGYLQEHADEAKRLSRLLIGDEAATILAAVRLLERTLGEETDR